MPPDDNASPRASALPPWPLRPALPLMTVLVIAGIVYAAGWHREISFEAIMGHRAAIVELIAAHPATAIAAYAAIYVAAVGLGLPVTMVMSTFGGFLFGTLLGGLTAVVSATSGATVIFLIARSAFGEHLVRRAGPLAAKFAAGLRVNAFGYLFLLRLAPVPFWLINLAAAALNIELKTFIAASGLGIIPLTFTFAFIGNSLDGVIALQAAAYRACLAFGQSDCRLDFGLNARATPLLLAAFGAVCVFALIPFGLKHWRARSRMSRASG
jgi:uncharacterized membrane protein YdjX (TVP38/TMEM64 family)